MKIQGKGSHLQAKERAPRNSTSPPEPEDMHSCCGSCWPGALCYDSPSKLTQVVHI